MILAGHGDQAKTIGDDSVFNPGKYTGKARNKGKDGQTVYPDVPHFVDNARLAMTEFVDVVLLRRVHRTRVAGSSRESDAVLGAMGEALREQYEKEGRRYMEVAHRLSDLTWTIEDHAWLSDRYVGKLQETAEGRRELEAAKGAMLLMDGQKESSTGDRGCQDFNAKELRRVARELRKPIASIRALHKQPKDQAGLKADQIHADDFHGGLQSSLEVCERSRVLLTVNLWVEAGLMNGAMGTVRGFVWPKGGDPASSDSSLRVPHAIIVEFDDVDLGTDKAGRKRSFFPDDASRANWVPIQRHSSSAHGMDSVSREQFPLILAWALTHWKAQGMTLRQVRARLGSRGVASVGVGYVVVTRVKHYRDLFFEQPLPPWEDFQKVRCSAEFRLRRRFALGLDAKFSATLRRHGHCAADPWSRDEAGIAEGLLKCLRAYASSQRARMGSRVPDDDDAYLWLDEAPAVGAMVQKAAAELAAERGIELGLCQCVAGRMQSELHMPAVKEALGCLIPADLHSTLDAKSARHRKMGDVHSEVFLAAGKWRVNVCLEQALSTGRLVKAGDLEFFLHLARRFCQCLRVPLAIGTSRAGELCGGELGAEEFALQAAKMKSMVEVAAGFGAANVFVQPVLWDPTGQGSHEWILVALRARDVSLLDADALEVRVWDRVGSRDRAEQVASRVQILFRHLARRTVACAALDLEVPEKLIGQSGTMCMVLGLLFGEVARRVGMEAPDLQARNFQADMQVSLRLGFQRLRREAELRNDRDVFVFLQDEQQCRKALHALIAVPDADDSRMLGQSRVAALPGDEVVPRTSCARGFIPVHALRVLTWNVSDVVNRLSAAVPEHADWTVADNMAAIQADVLRRKPDVVALQECQAAAPLHGLSEHYALVGAAASHCGFVHLYVAHGLETTELRGLVSDGLKRRPPRRPRMPTVRS